MGRSTLNGARILVLEDDYYLANDLQAALEEAGATIIGPFADALQASETLDVDPPNCALIDLNLGQGISFHVPRELLRRAIPFAFVTGYDRTAIPQEFAAVPRLEKPVAEQQAGKIVERLLAAQPTRRTSA